MVAIHNLFLLCFAWHLPHGQAQPLSFCRGSTNHQDNYQSNSTYNLGSLFFIGVTTAIFHGIGVSTAISRLTWLVAGPTAPKLMQDGTWKGKLEAGFHTYGNILKKYSTPIPKYVYHFCRSTMPFWETRFVLKGMQDWIRTFPMPSRKIILADLSSTFFGAIGIHKNIFQQLSKGASHADVLALWTPKVPSRGLQERLLICFGLCRQPGLFH